MAGWLILAGGAPAAWAAGSGAAPGVQVSEWPIPEVAAGVDPPAAIQTHRWPLVGHTNDVVGDAHMALTGAEGIDYMWTEDRACRPERALGLTGTGQGFASTTGPVLSTEESFSVATWVGLPSLTDRPADHPVPGR